MGVDIALLFAQHGFEVMLWHHSCADTALQRLNDRLNRYVAKEVFSTETAQALRDVIQVTHHDECAASCDLVVESIVENYETKAALLTMFDRLMSSENILVTNTSSFSINRLGRELTQAGRFAGLHFFNPATKMDLVEIVAGEGTSSETLECLRKLAGGIGKTAVSVKDVPGFIVNRLLMIQINSAIQLLEAGAATAEDIDQAIVSGLGHKKGPLSLADFIGLDVVRDILTSIYEATNDSSYKPPALLTQMVDKRQMGRKSGVGFFGYKKSQHSPAK
jgi:3-hydroxybutyryl-CoA dehydrogenase